MKKVWKKVLAFGLCGVLIFSVMPPLPVMAKNVQRNIATNSNAEKNENTPVATKSNADTANKATLSNALRAANSLGDIWDDWSGKTSFEFLNGTQGDGSEKKPFLIKNREQLMGLSELAAMGMMIPDAGGADYPGDYSGCFFALGGNIDMQGVDWIPIGFYGDSSESAGPIVNAFQGDFDGNGYTIRNLKLNKFVNYNHVGLFGAISNSLIHDLIVIPDATEIKGNDRVGSIVGYAVDSKIINVKVKNAALNTTGITGGIAGEVSNTVIENAICDNVIIDASNGAEIIYIGGIVGIASDSAVVDCEVTTGSGNTARIQGTGFTGGIIGYQNSADIYNVYVKGTIGGYHSTAIGGITGKYVSGKLKVARFEGTIGNSQLGSMAREGTFIGTRQGAATNFDYIDDVAYLFADSESKISANVCGSEIPDDNDYTYDAHIGYWHNSDLYFTLMQGGTSKNITDQYFYEILEEGILSIMDEEGAGQYRVDHFAPNSVGRPVRGYLVIVNQIDTIANGQNFYDIATLTAKGASQYAKTLDKEHRGAVAAGAVVNVSTAPNNTDTEKFQMEGTPYYTNADGVKKDTTYSDASHSYTFKMPEEDIVIDATYKKVAVSIQVQPDTYNFSVTQTRTGNRKYPTKITEVKNKEGKLIARYINGSLDQGMEVQPVMIQAVIDADNDVYDNRVKWSIDDADLITLAQNDDEGSDGYTAKSASVTLNLNSRFFEDIITDLEGKQAEENYQYKIPNTIYGAGHQNGGVAILTAATRPSTSFEGKPCTANCRINVTFQIIDNTLVAAEGAVLDKMTLEYTVTRRLTGDRLSPQESITVTAPQSLTATFLPDYFSKEEVTWKSSDPAVIGVSQDNVAYREASVSAYKDAKWIKDIIATDNGVISNDRYASVSGHGERQAIISVEGKDKLGNRATADCQVTVRYVTEDQTVIKPEAVELDQATLTYELSYDKAGDIRSETIKKNGFEPKKLSAVVLPDIEDTESHRPYDRTVKWSSSDPAVLSVDATGNLTVIDEAPWMQEAMAQAPYQAAKEIFVTATTADGKKIASCKVNLQFQVNCIEADREKESYRIVLTKSGRRSAPILTYTGQESKKLKAAIYPESSDLNYVVWISKDPEVITVAADGTITPVLLDENNELKAQWIKEILQEYPYSGTKTVEVTASTTNGKMSDGVIIDLEFVVIDNTYSSGGSGGGSTGGGGGGGSTGVTPTGKTQSTGAPAGSVTGSWTQAANGKWLFAAGRTYADEWAYINNPYASAGQPAASWFRFDPDGFMVVGWYTDNDGNIYYLNPISDGTQGQMLTGWQYIDGAWYYFNPESDGTRGKLLTNTIIGGYQLNEKGQWVEEEIVTTK